jgi:hypothetical protein
MAAIFGQFGDTLAGLTDNGFFNWFNLAATGETAGEGEAIYRPTGEVFHALVSLTSRAGPAGELQSLALAVERAFIDSPRQGSFARDIIKSFLGAVAGPQDQTLGPIVTEIQFRDAPGPILMRGDPPALPDKPSPAFLVMTGAKSSAEIDLARVRLTLANETVGSPRFAIRAEPRIAGRRRGWLDRLLGR